MNQIFNVIHCLLISISIWENRCGYSYKSEFHEIHVNRFRELCSDSAAVTAHGAVVIIFRTIDVAIRRRFSARLHGAASRFRPLSDRTIASINTSIFILRCSVDKIKLNRAYKNIYPPLLTHTVRRIEARNTFSDYATGTARRGFNLARPKHVQYMNLTKHRLRRFPFRIMPCYILI